jgi:hypothetical protein
VSRGHNYSYSYGFEGSFGFGRWVVVGIVRGKLMTISISVFVCVYSFLDILYLGRIFPKRAVIMAKKELRWAPLLGQYRQSSSPHLSRRLPIPLPYETNRFNNDFAFLLDLHPAYPVTIQQPHNSQ